MSGRSASGAGGGGGASSSSAAAAGTLVMPADLATAPLPASVFALLQPSVGDYNTYLESVRTMAELITNAAVDAATDGDETTTARLEKQLKAVLHTAAAWKSERACIEQLRAQRESLTLDAAVAQLTAARTVSITDEEIKRLPDVRSFREKVWTAAHPHEPMPEDNDGDDDIVVKKATKTYQCPITLRQLESPMKNSACGHAYSKDAILEMVRKSKTKSVRCPTAGCRATVEEAKLTEDKALEREMLRMASQPTLAAPATQYEEVDD